MVMKIEVDLTKNGSGALAGTFGQPEQGVKGLPLSTVAVSGSAVRFVLKAGPEAASFQGTLSADLPFSGWGRNHPTGAGITASVLRVWL